MGSYRIEDVRSQGIDRQLGTALSVPRRRLASSPQNHISPRAWHYSNREPRALIPIDVSNPFQWGWAVSQPVDRIRDVLHCGKMKRAKVEARLECKRAHERAYWPSAPVPHDLHEGCRVMQAQRQQPEVPGQRPATLASSLHRTLTVSVYEGVIVVVTTDVRLQWGVREGGRRPVPVAHNSHL